MVEHCAAGTIASADGELLLCPVALSQAFHHKADGLPHVDEDNTPCEDELEAFVSKTEMALGVDAGKRD